MPMTFLPSAAEKTRRAPFAGQAGANDAPERVSSSFDVPRPVLHGLERIANVPSRLPREIFTKIASYLMDFPKDVIAFSSLDRDCAENLHSERIFCKVMLRIDDMRSEDLTVDAFGMLVTAILDRIPQVHLAGAALVHLVSKMRFPTLQAAGKWFNQILATRQIAPARKAQVLAVLAQKNNISRVDKMAFQRIMDVVMDMPAALRSAETCEEAKTCNSTSKYHKGALTGLVALSVTQPTEAKKHETMVILVEALKAIPIAHRAAPLYQFAWFLGYFKDRQSAFDRILDAAKAHLPKAQRSDVLQRLDVETWRLRPDQRAQARLSLQRAASGC